jgi:cation diffusion facilitator CzcD-associated flavoprotein CzcO
VVVNQSIGKVFDSKRPVPVYPNDSSDKFEVAAKVLLQYFKGCADCYGLDRQALIAEVHDRISREEKAK